MTVAAEARARAEMFQQGIAPAHVTLDVPFQLVLFMSSLLESSDPRIGLVGGSAPSLVEVPRSTP